MRLAQSNGRDGPGRRAGSGFSARPDQGTADRPEEVLAIGNPGDESVLRFESGFFVIGRGDQSDLKINHKFTSREHARIVRSGGRFFFLEDCSRNGTYLHQDGMDEIFLKPGQRVPLIGHGIIGLGVPAVSGTPGTILYRVVQIARP